MTHKLGICIPYRNRKEHIERLIPHLSKHLDKQGIDYHIYVGHQTDDNIFNRGIMKNIAAVHALEDGCDYIAWHDVDGLPSEYVNFSYPEDYPLMLVKNKLQERVYVDDPRFFGGCVLFNKDHVYMVNGYSNEYWGWGYEDTDLLIRCEYEGLVNVTTFKKYGKTKFAKFNGKTSYIQIPSFDYLRNSFFNDHTISILFYPQINDGDKIFTRSNDSIYKNYPILRKEEGLIWGVNYNNSEQIQMAYYDLMGEWCFSHSKNPHNQWMWITISYSKKDKLVYFYVNRKLVKIENTFEDSGPINLKNGLYLPGIELGDFILGKCDYYKEFFKGKIAKFNVYDTFFNNVEEVYETKRNLIYSLDFNNLRTSFDIEYGEEEIEVIENKNPYYRNAHFRRLDHLTENKYDNPYVLKNEKRYCEEMLVGKINYKKDGLNNVLEYVLEMSTDKELYPNTTFINTKLKYEA